MFTQLFAALSAAAVVVQGSPVNTRAVSCPNLFPCGGQNPTADSNASGTRCSYLRYGIQTGQITSFRCYFDNAGALIASPAGFNKISDPICPALSTGSCPIVATSSTLPPATATTSSVVVPPSATPSVSPTLAGRRIHPNQNGGKCLDVRGAVYANGTPVQIYDCNGTPAQNWVWNEASTKIQLANSNFCLDAGSSPGNGIGMKIWQCYNGLAAQQYYRTGDKRFAVEGKGQCLDLTDGKLQNSVQMQTWACGTGNTNQIWTQ